MRAIILAGGSGTRLRPLTCDRPKPMVRVCGRPVIEYSFDLLTASGIKNATVTLGYLAEAISGYYGHSYNGISLNYTIEEKPLGTAGGARLACEGESGPAVILSGDAVCDFDLALMMDEFSRTGADALLAVKRVDDPREYGLVICEQTGRVSGFIEKPSYLQAVSELANTGIYILSQRALDLIPATGAFDFAKDLFPLMLENNMSIHAMPQEGYWCDIGDIDSYIRCQANLLYGHTRCKFKSTIAPGGSYQLDGEVFIGNGVHIGNGCVIEGPCVLDDYAALDDGCLIKGSVILPGARIGGGSSLRGALVDSRATVGAGAMLFEGSVVGQGSRIGSRAVVSAGVRVWPDKTVEPGAKVSENLKTGGVMRLEFGERGIEGEAGEGLTPELCVRIGAAVATAVGGEVAVAHADSPACEALADALSSGIRSSGADVLRIGAAPPSVLGYCVGKSGSAVGLYLGGGVLRLMAPSGLGVSRAVERSIEGALARAEYSRAFADSFGRERRETLWSELYAQMLMYEIGSIEGVSAGVAAQDSATRQFAESILAQLGAVPGNTVFYLGGDIESLSLRSKRRSISPSRCVLLAAMPNVIKGRDIALPSWIPPLGEDWALSHGIRVHRYSASPSDNSDGEARRIATQQAWQNDPIYAMLRILRLIKETGKSVDELDDMLPAFAEEERELPVSGNPAWIVGNLGGSRMPDGVQVDLPSGSVIVRPTKRGNAIRILAQGYSAEAANELCDFVAGVIAEKTPK